MNDETQTRRIESLTRLREEAKALHHDLAQRPSSISDTLAFEARLDQMLQRIEYQLENAEKD